jgi:hypothetical protein
MNGMRYALFVGDIYYPGGGFHDYDSSYPTKEEAINKGREILKEKGGDGWGWFHVMDLEKMEMVEDWDDL